LSLSRCASFQWGGVMFIAAVCYKDVLLLLTVYSSIIYMMYSMYINVAYLD